MQHVAIDLGGRESQVCVRGADGEIVEERRVATTGLGRYLAKQPHSRVVLETCAEGFHVADQALAAGHEVRVVPAAMVRALGVGARGIKTDVRDARVLSEVSCRVDVPSVHIPSEQSRQWKTLCGMRDRLIGARTQLINCVRGWLRTQAVRVRGGQSKTFGQRVRERYGADGVPAYVEPLLTSIELLSEELHELDRQLKKAADEHEVCRRLMTVPGVGPVTALKFVATIDTPERFSNAHAVASYVGLVPGERSSSDRQRRTSITKAGAASLRSALVQGAWAVWRSRNRQLNPMARWAIGVAERRGRFVAVVALARKLAGVLYALWRDGTTYDRGRSATASPASSTIA